MQAKGTAQQAFGSLPNYPRESAPLSAWYCGTRDRAARLPTNRRFRAGFLRPGRAEQDKNRQEISFPREGEGFVQIRIPLLEVRLRGFQASGREAPNARPRASLPQNNADLMLPTVVDERNVWGIGQRLAVHFNQNDTA